MRVYVCKLCNYRNQDKSTMGKHYDTKHKDQLPDDMDGYRYFYFLLTKRDRGSCQICHEETAFNKKTMRYIPLCDKEECRTAYRKIFESRMIKKYGKVHLLNDPDRQKLMLAARKISGVYKWSDDKSEFSYVGSYELDFLKFLDGHLNWNPEDIMSPSPHIFEYFYDEKRHFYIPDFYIPSLKLEVEVKDAGTALNRGEDIRKKDELKEELMRSNSSFFNYIMIKGKDYTKFLEMIRR